MLLEDGFEVRPGVAQNANSADKDGGAKVLMPKHDGYDNQSNEVWIKKKESMKAKAGKGKTKDQSEFKWRLLPKNQHDDDAFFYFEVTQPGRQNPRLVTHSKKSSGFELGGLDICHTLIATRKYTSGEKHDKIALWEIVKVEPIQ